MSMVLQKRITNHNLSLLQRCEQEPTSCLIAKKKKQRCRKHIDTFIERTYPHKLYKTLMSINLSNGFCMLERTKEQTQSGFLSIYLPIDGFLRSQIIHTSHLLHVTLNQQHIQGMKSHCHRPIIKEFPHIPHQC